MSWFKKLFHWNPTFEGRNRLLPGVVPGLGFYPAAMPQKVVRGNAKVHG